MRCTHNRRQEAMAIWETKISSVGVAGWCSESSRSTRASNSAGSSLGRMRVSAYKPYLRPFRRTAARPSGVDGPVLCCALRRFASICRSDDKAHLRRWRLLWIWEYNSRYHTSVQGQENGLGEERCARDRVVLSG